MNSPLAYTFSKEERLCGKTNISALIASGRWGSSAHIKYCYLITQENRPNRIMVSVPKKLFKRAVKRNLLKRRIREAYRNQKHILDRKGVDIMFMYNSAAILPYFDIFLEIESILKRIAG